LQDNNVTLDTRDFFKDPLTVSELKQLIGSRPITDFISTRAKSYKESGWLEKPPTKAAAIAGMIKDPTLLKRPILIAGNTMLIGFSQSAYEEIVG
jgi:arsenate reductase